MRYAVINQTLNGKKTIERALLSLLHQSIPPSRIIVMDGGSTDGTWELLQRMVKRYPQIKIRQQKLGDESVNIVHLYNTALKMLGRGYDWYFFAADDCVFSHRYVERLLAHPVDIMSGDWGIPQDAPCGAGRMVSQKVMKAVGFRFPVMYGYESWLLYKAEQLGFKLRCFNNIRFNLLTKFGVEAWHPKSGKGHGFVEWGRGMRCLGYIPSYVILRCVSDLTRKSAVPKWKAIRMCLDYFATYLGWSRNDPYYRMAADSDYYRFVAKDQRRMVRGAFKTEAVTVARPILNKIRYFRKWGSWVISTKDFTPQGWRDQAVIRAAKTCWVLYYTALFSLFGKKKATAIIVQKEQSFLDFLLRDITIRTSNGVLFYCRKRKSDLNIVSEYYEQKQIQKYLTLKQGDVFIDLGANVGKYALLASKLVGPSGRVFAVEPDPSCIPILYKNRALNLAWNLTIIHAAIGRKNGLVKLNMANDGSRSTMSSIYWIYNDKPTATVQVPQITLDHLAEKYGLKRIDWLKLDVEGAEYDAFLGAKKSLKLIHHVYLEVHYKRLELKIRKLLSGFRSKEMSRLDENRAWLIFHSLKVH